MVSPNCSWIFLFHFYFIFDKKILHKTHVVCFYFHGSVHRDSVLIRSNKMKQYAGIYLLQVYSTCFGRPTRPSSGVQKSVTAVSSTDRCSGTMTSLAAPLYNRFPHYPKNDMIL